MSADVEPPTLLPALPAFARPTSLFVPDVPRTTSLLDTSSYSPFPPLPGQTRTQDPYGLNAYLLHPGDALWEYVDPRPDTTPSGSASASESEGEGEGVRRVGPRQPVQAGNKRNSSLRKQRSLSVLRRPSPLSQSVSVEPPADAGGDSPTRGRTNEREVRVRKRSSSLGSAPSPRETATPIEAHAPVWVESEVVDPFLEKEPVVPVEKAAGTPKTPKGKKGLRKAFTFGRKSLSKADPAPSPSPAVSPAVAVVPSVPAIPTLSLPNDVDEVESDAPLAGPHPSHPSTPMSTRSNSNLSTLSSASSTSSSEGVKTPAEGAPLEVVITGTKLASALQEAGERKRGKMWGWLGGGVRKKGELGGSRGGSAESSASSTPNSSTPDLLAVPTLGASPSIRSPSPPSTETTPTVALPSQLALEHTWLTEQLRHASARKLTQLKAPSPHPLALALVRQNSRLPDEVALSIQSGRRVFPKSVNTWQGLGDLSPAQGGLRLGLAVKGVMLALDRGEQPQGGMMARRGSKRSIVPRPRGVLDFIVRPPFEERNIVFFPGGAYSPISMARPGYGVWDLDFSGYIMALGAVDEGAAAPGGMTPPRLQAQGPEQGQEQGGKKGWGVRSSLEEGQEGLDQVMMVIAEGKVEERLGEAVAAVEATARPGESVLVPERATEQEREDGEEVQDAQAALRALTANEKPPRTSSLIPSVPPPSLEAPALSSFRPRQPTSSRTPDISDSEDDSDDEPLSLVHRRSQLFKPSSQALAPPADARTRSISTPNRLSTLTTLAAAPPLPPLNAGASRSFDSGARKQQVEMAAMEEVQRARERREMNTRGEMERRAMGEKQREKRESVGQGYALGTAYGQGQGQEKGKRESRKLSMMDLRSAPDLRAHKRASSGGASGQRASVMLQPPIPHHQHQQRSRDASPAARAHDGQRRSVMYPVSQIPPDRTTSRAPSSSSPPRSTATTPKHQHQPRPEVTRSKTGGLEKSRGRYSSFYEQRGASTPSLQGSAGSRHQHQHPQPPHHQHFAPPHLVPQGHHYIAPQGYMVHPHPHAQQVQMQQAYHLQQMAAAAAAQQQQMGHRGSMMFGLGLGQAVGGYGYGTGAGAGAGEKRGSRIA
ncbi:hypothetical protein IAT38_004151 [Cryptococcus sp. DSM 104549]